MTGLAPKHHVRHREAHAARDRQPVGRCRGHRPGGVGRLEHHGGTRDRYCHPQHDRQPQRLAEHQAREERRPGRHQVEQQHDTDHVADRHRPVEAGVGDAAGEQQRPQRRRAGEPSHDRRVPGQHCGAHRRVYQRGRPQAVHALLLQGAERQPAQPPEQCIDEQGRRRAGGGRHGRHVQRAASRSTTPASRIAASAAASEPSRSIARQASSSTTASKPWRRASMAEYATQ